MMSLNEYVLRIERSGPGRLRLLISTAPRAARRLQRALERYGAWVRAASTVAVGRPECVAALVAGLVSDTALVAAVRRYAELWHDGRHGVRLDPATLAARRKAVDQVVRLVEEERGEE